MCEPIDIGSYNAIRFRECRCVSRPEKVPSKTVCSNTQTNSNLLGEGNWFVRDFFFRTTFRVTKAKIYGLKQQHLKNTDQWYRESTKDSKRTKWTNKRHSFIKISIILLLKYFKLLLYRKFIIGPAGDIPWRWSLASVFAVRRRRPQRCT